MESEQKNQPAAPKRSRFSTRKLVLAVAVALIVVVASAYVISRNLSAPVSTGRVVTFDFDSGYPVFLEGQNLPFNQTSDEVTAYFSSPSDVAEASAFSIQSYETTFTRLSQFSGRYVYDNRPTRDVLEIRFSQPLRSISLTFATVEYKSDPTGPTDITLTAYEGSADTAPVGTTLASGTVLSDLYPQGLLSYDSGGEPFNLVRIEMSSNGSGEATNFFVDNIRVNLMQ
jgi:hypothetical protein